jgi:hypothetical protein
MEPQLSRKISDSGYDITPISNEERELLAKDLGRNVCLPPMRPAAFYLEVQIQFGNGLAVILCAV